MSRAVRQKFHLFLEICYSSHKGLMGRCTQYQAAPGERC